MKELSSSSHADDMALGHQYFIFHHHSKLIPGYKVVFKCSHKLVSNALVDYQMKLMPYVCTASIV